MAGKAKLWLEAARLRTLPLALSSILMGSVLAYFSAEFDWLIFALTILTTTFLQVLSNFANDYGDSQNGADTVEERVGPSRTVQQGAISQKEMKSAILLMILACLALGVPLVIIALGDISLKFWLFIGLGLASIVAAIKYTAGKNPYGYAGLGDVFVYLFFGLVGVLGTYYLQTNTLFWEAILPASAIGLLSVGVLNINNIRDIVSDEKAGKMSIPVRIGEKKSKIYHMFLLAGAMDCLIVFNYLFHQHLIQWTFLLVLPLVLLNARAVWTKSGADLDPYLKQLALTTLLTVLLFGAGHFLHLFYIW